MCGLANMTEITLSLFQNRTRCGGDARRLSMPMSSSGGRADRGQRRKFSFPVSLQSNLLSLERAAAQRRRFSNVSDAVTRKLSGWTRLSPLATKEIVQQGKTLCAQYIRCRLKRAGLLPRKCGLQRLRSAASLPGGYVVREVLPKLVALGQELERWHPQVYTGVARQACPGSGLATERALAAALRAVAKQLAQQPSWPRLVSLYAVAGGLAVDAVSQGHPEFLQAITEAMADALHDHFAQWIADNGGWTGLLSYCKPPSSEMSLGGFLGILGAILACSLILALFLRWYGRYTHIS